MAKDPNDLAWTTTTYAQTYKNNIPKSTIKYEPVELPSSFKNASTENSDGNRLYLIEEKKYPSITTVIKATDKEGSEALKQWRVNVGADKAQEISMKAANAGVKWHTFCEKYLTQEPLDWRYFTEPESSFQANNIAAALEENVDTVIASEVIVKSNYYGIAGRMDVAIKLKDGRYAIVDYKSGKKPKFGNRLSNAAIQGTFYGDALAENTSGIDVSTIIIIQILPNMILWQESPITHWRPLLKKKIREYSKILNS